MSRNCRLPLALLAKIIIFCSSVIFLASAASFASSQAPIFRGERIDYEALHSVGGYLSPLDMQFVRLGDFHGDGRTELLVVNDPCGGTGGIHFVHLLEGGGIGSVSTAANISGCAIPNFQTVGDSVALGDFHGDGRLSVAFWRSRKLYHMSPGGAFTESSFLLPLDPTPGFEGLPRQIAGDLNRDALADVVVVQPFLVFDFVTFNIYQGTNLYVFLADGHGGFTRSQKIETPADPNFAFYLLPVSLADFTGDGLVDYLGAGSRTFGAAETAEILTGDGAGHLSSFQSGIPLTPGLPFDSNNSWGRPSAIGDLNGDHLPDLVFGFSSYGNAGALYMSLGVGAYTELQQLTIPYQGQLNGATSSSIHDADSDGRQDVQVYGSGFALAFLQRADGTFSAGPFRRMPLDPSGELLLRWDEDFLEDRIYFGRPLPAYTYPPPTASLSVFLSHGSPNRDFADIDVSSEVATTVVVSGDFDGDGHQDLASVNKNGITLHRGNGRGGFVREVGLTSPGAFRFDRIVTGDWNGDGRTDLVALRPSATQVDGPGTFTLYLSQASPNPRFIPGTTMEVGPRPIKGVSFDLNGDRKLDLMVGGRGVRYPGSQDLLVNGTILSFMGDGAGGFAAGVSAYDLPPGYLKPEFRDVEVENVDDDGTPDLVLMAGYGSQFPVDGYWGTGNGDGTFEFFYYFGSTEAGHADPLLKPRDLNGDGFTDFLLSPVIPQIPTSLINATFMGTQELDYRFTVASDCCLTPGNFVDLDGDGFSDLLGFASSDSLRFASGVGTGQFLRFGPDYSPTAFPFSFPYYEVVGKNPINLQADFDEDGRLDNVTIDGMGHIRVLFNRAGRVASDPAESLTETDAGTHPVDPEIDLVEVHGRVGAYDFAGTGTPQGALVLTMAINQFTELESSQDESGGGLVGQRDGSEPARGFGSPGRLHPTNGVAPGLEGSHAALKSGSFQLFMNFGEPLRDSDGDGFVDLSLANARQEPGLSGIPLADLTLNLRLDTKGPAFTGLQNINRFSTVDRDKGIATFVIPFEQMLSALTPIERASLDQGDGTGRLFLWAVSKLNGDRDRIPDTNDGGEPTVHSEVREFRFPLMDAHATPSVEYGDVRIGRHVDAPVTLSNRGVRPIQFTSLEPPDPMVTEPITAPFSIPALGRLQLPPRFSPTAHASFSGDMHLGSSALEQDLSIFMSGRGVAPVLRVTPLSMNFGSIPVGFTSDYQEVEVKNVGDDWLEGSWELQDALHQFGFFGFSLPDEPFPLELYPGQGTRFNVTFTAVQEGAAAGILRILSDDELAPQVDVQLTAFGAPPEPRISVSNSYVNPIQGAPIGGEGSSSIRIDNQGGAALEIAVTSSNPLFTTSMSSNPIQPKSSGSLTVTYHPVAWGLETTTLTITHNDPTRPALTRTIGGRAFEPPPIAQVTPATLDFGSLHQGASATLSFEVRNVGAGPLYLTGYPPFFASYCTAQTDLSLPATILPGGAISANVTYTADINKSHCGSFYFLTNDPARSQVTMQLLATILSPRIAFGSYTLLFPNTPVGSSSTGSLTAYNLGPEPLIISGIFGYNPAFSLSTPLPLTIPPGGNSELEFLFSPSNFGGTGDSVTLYTNDLNYRQVYLSLTGYGIPASTLRSRQLTQ
jgi:hypothetical protein